MKQIYLQQGDVILYRERNVPNKAKKVNFSGNSFVLEKGEGVNTHELRHSNLQKAINIYETGKEYFLEIVAPIVLVHQEHGTAQLQEGIVISKQKEREWDYETEEARAVMD